MHVKFWEWHGQLGFNTATFIFFQFREKNLNPETQIESIIRTSKHHTLQIHHPFLLNQAIKEASCENINEHQLSNQQIFKNTQPILKTRLPMKSACKGLSKTY